MLAALTDLLPGLMTLAGGALLRSVRASLSTALINRDVARAYCVRGRKIGIGAFWHAHLIPIAGFCVDLNAVVMVSRSRDGELIARAVERTPLSTVRGSSSRGGREALDELIDAVRGGRPGAFACDGPKGPPREVKMGVVVAAKRTGAPIIPIAFAAARALRLRSWDRTVIPVPGTRAAFAFGDPIPVPPDASDADCDRIRGELKLLLDSLEQRCVARVATGRLL